MEHPFAPNLADRFEARDLDWRAGAVVYQVFVDRFAPSADLAGKRALYPAPKRLRDWHETPAKGHFVPEAGVWSHEIDFWGGDLSSVRARLGHLEALSADVLYLNPIHAAYTNHKYDSADYLEVSPEYGSRADLRMLVGDAHARGLKVVLDGVFNHVGRRHRHFEEAMRDEHSPYRSWFFIGPQYPNGYRGWADVANLPDLHVERDEVRRHLWLDAGSAVRSYLRDGVDGWRLDVASDLGPHFLRELTQNAHEERPGSLVVGEIWNAPAGWDACLDGILNMQSRMTVLDYCRGRADGPTTAERLADMVADAGIEFVLRCWTTLENHDTERLAGLVPDLAMRRIAHLLQATLPGAPNLYFGQEVGAAGGADPENRAPMRWDLVHDGNPEWTFVRELYRARRGMRALAKGDVTFLRTKGLLAFLRTTDRPLETVLVVANATDREVEEQVSVRDGRLMAGTNFRDSVGLGQSVPDAHVHMGFVTLKVPARTACVMKIVPPAPGQHSPYKRMS
ncbi:MAG: alpha-glucosidase C-terminal domain-containing protein [Planctomycetaceae bacterium]|nr:alpha-glucosidase C-terminal domain-containing protein [Planctomycetaceae bacterium]